MKRVREYEPVRPFLEFADEGGEVVLRVRQATRQGYAVVRVGGVFDRSYPSSKLRRARVQGNGGDICPTLLCATQETLAVLVRIEQDAFKREKESCEEYEFDTEKRH